LDHIHTLGDRGYIHIKASLMERGIR